MEVRQDPGRELLLHRLCSATGIPAVGAATVNATGVEWFAAIGERVRGSGRPAEVGDRWHLGSCTKAVTAAHYALLVEAAHSRWDSTIPDLFAGLPPGTIHPAWEPVTIEQILTHRAGLPRDLPLAALAAGHTDTRLPAEQRFAATATALANPPDRVGAFFYSNLGYIIAGAAIEQATGQPWESSVIADLLTPLGITSAGFGPPTGDQPWGHPARRPRQGTGRGIPVDPGTPEQPNDAADNPPVMSPAGRLHLTLEDWAKFIALFLTDGATLLQPGSIAKLTTAPPGRGPRQAMGWALPPVGAGHQYALGQQGSNTLWAATAVITPDRRRAALVVCNDGRNQLLDATARLAIRLLSNS